MYKVATSAVLPCGTGGLDGNQNTYQVSINNLVLANNIRFDNKSIRKSPGALSLDGPVDSALTCFGGISWWPNIVDQRQVTAWSDGTIYKETSGNINSVLLKSGLSVSKPFVFVPAGYSSGGSADARQLLIFSKDVKPQYLSGDGTALTDFTALSPDWVAGNYPGGAVYHDFRVWAFNLTTNPHLLYGSSADDHIDFATSGAGKAFALPIMPGFKGGGKGILACQSYLNQYLYIFKAPRGIFYIDTTADPATDFGTDFIPIYTVTEAVGVAGPRAVTKINQDMWFISSQGRIYSAVTLRPDIDPKLADITNQLNLTSFIKDNVDLSRIEWAILEYDKLRHELRSMYTSIGSNTVNNAAIIFTFSDQNTIKVSTDNRASFYNAAWSRINTLGEQELLVAGSGGKVYICNHENRSIDGEPFIGEYSHPATDFSYLDPQLSQIEKRFDFLEFMILPTGNYDMSIDVTVDGVFRQTLSVNLGSDAASVFDEAIFDSSTFAGRNFLPHRVEINAVGTQISFRCYNAVTNEDFAIANMRVIFQPLGAKFEE